ncbi:MAG: helix-turn-helix domain-containing protein [Spirochaetes bacterium]|nr:helix-turn-helix domain-containing protein [Spirochaetota bacterium]
MKNRRLPERQQVDYWRAAAPQLAAGSYLLRDFLIEVPGLHWHQHPEIELIQFLGGHGHRFIGDSVAPFAPGDVYLLGGDLPHGWARRTGEKARTRVLQFRPGALGDLIPTHHELSGVRALLGAARPGLRLKGPARDAASDFLAAASHWRPGDGRRVSGLLSFLVECALALGDGRRLEPLSSGPTGDTAGEDPSFDRLLLSLHERRGEALTQKEVAASVGRKPAAFSRWFSRRTQAPFERYLLELRLSGAARALIEGTEPIGEIAAENGFVSLTHFYRAFRRRHGLTPAAFREKAQRALER